MTRPNDSTYPVVFPGFTYGGMTKREALALGALQGVLANPDTPMGPREAAIFAVDCADKLIEALNNPLVAPK